MSNGNDDFDLMQAGWQTQLVPDVDMEALLGEALRKNRRDLVLRTTDVVIVFGLAALIAARWSAFDMGSRVLVVAMLLIALTFSAGWLREAWKRGDQPARTPAEVIEMAEGQARGTIGYWRTSLWFSVVMICVVGLLVALDQLGLFDAGLAFTRILPSLLGSIAALTPFAVFGAWRVRRERARLGRLRALRRALCPDGS